MTSENALGSAGYAITGSGGGGSGGEYVFASLAELDSIIREWTTVRDGIKSDRDKIWQAQQLMIPPADDEPSRGQAAALIDSLTRALDHNDALRDYADSYIARLTAVRERYLTTDEQSAARLRGIDA